MVSRIEGSSPRVTTGVTASRTGASAKPGSTSGAPVLELPLGPTGLGALAGTTPGLGRSGVRGATKALGVLPGGAALTLGTSGRFLAGGKLPSELPGRGADAEVLDAAGRIAAAQQGLFAQLPMNATLREKVLSQLSSALDHALGAKKSVHRAQVTAGALTLLIDLASSAPKSASSLFDQIVTKLLDTLGALDDVEQRAFYLRSMKSVLGSKLDSPQRSALRKLERALMPAEAPVEAWTENRTKPLEVRHTIHPEFWKEELAFFSKKNGFTLLKKNAGDTERTYRGEIPDPAGKKPKLVVNMTVRKDELDYLESMSDPGVHVVLYSGHSALGGNGSQAIQDAGPMKGSQPKLVFAANCRGKDNYAAFTNKYPEAHVIMTEHPTYGPSGQARIEAIFDTLARGESYAYMRKQSEEAWWDEPADNYFYPDESRKFRFMDSDSDGKLDVGSLGVDRHFDAGARAGADKFVRAVNFANSELFYHWEVEHEHGKKSYYGKEYSDSLVPDGRLTNPAAGRLVEVTPAGGSSGQKRFRVRYADGPARVMDQNLYAGLATTQIILALAQDKAKKIDLREALRAVLMGSQAIHYLDVYSDTNPKNQRRFFEELGLGKKIDPKKVDHIFNSFDANASTAQVEAFEALLKDDYGIDLQAWLPGLLLEHAPPVEKKVA